MANEHEKLAKYYFECANATKNNDLASHYMQSMWKMLSFTEIDEHETLLEVLMEKWWMTSEHSAYRSERYKDWVKHDEQS